jgi:hypothetical protein
MWGLSINFNKCKLLHFGNTNLCFQYKLGDNVITVSQCEKILGVLIDNKLSFADHVYYCIKKSSQICNLILSNMYFVNNDILLKLYKTYARPYLDYASVVYSPHFLYLIDAVEGVQRQFTKRMHKLNNLSYVNRLQIVDLESLELRRIRTDLINVYKIMHGNIKTCLNDNFVCENVKCTRGNVCKLYKDRFRLDVRKYFFTCRVIDVWNSLDNNVVICKSVDKFACELKKMQIGQFFKGRTLI